MHVGTTFQAFPTFIHQVRLKGGDVTISLLGEGVYSMVSFSLFSSTAPQTEPQVDQGQLFQLIQSLIVPSESSLD